MGLAGVGDGLMLLKVLMKFPNTDGKCLLVKRPCFSERTKVNKVKVVFKCFTAAFSMSTLSKPKQKKGFVRNYTFVIL